METHLHHLQLTTWQVVAQNCAFLCVPNSHQSHTLDHGPRIFPMSRILEINLWKRVKSKFHISTIKMSFPNKITQSYENEMWDVKTMTMSLRISNKHGNLFLKNGHSNGFINKHGEGEGSSLWSPNCLNAQIILMKARIIPHPHKHKI